MAAATPASTSRTGPSGPLDLGRLRLSLRRARVDGFDDVAFDCEPLADPRFEDDVDEGDRLADVEECCFVDDDFAVDGFGGAGASTGVVAPTPEGASALDRACPDVDLVVPGASIVACAASASPIVARVASASPIVALADVVPAGAGLASDDTTASDGSIDEVTDSTAETSDSTGESPGSADGSSDSASECEASASPRATAELSSDSAIALAKERRFSTGTAMRSLR